jgi:hypothetical protein
MPFSERAAAISEKNTCKLGIFTQKLIAQFDAPFEELVLVAILKLHVQVPWHF